jgi:hypothetical protein
VYKFVEPDTHLLPQLVVKRGSLLENRQLKQLWSSSRRQSLHIATHGFFLQDPGQGKHSGGEAASDPENPLLRSGLALSCAFCFKRPT